MVAGQKQFYNVFVGAETGILKGVSINPKENHTKNFHRLKSLRKENEITSLNWVSDGEILFGTRDQRVSGFDPTDNSFTHGRKAEDDSDTPIIGLGRLPEETLVTAYQSGTVKIWRSKPQIFNALDKQVILSSTSGRKRKRKILGNEDIDSEIANKVIANLKTGKDLRCMKLEGHLLATGGQEHDLHITDFGSGSDVIFRAKNVPLDMLQLRVPIWISDLAFLEPSVISTVSRHSHIRLYDIRAQRRPVVSFGYPNVEPLTCMSRISDKEYQILVGTAQGGLAQYDLKMGLKGMVQKYKGSVGSVRSIYYGNGHFASVGLDRFLRIYSLGTRSKHARIYLKSRLNHVVLRKGFDPDFEETVESSSKSIKENEGDDNDDDIEILEDDDEEMMWSNMDTIREPSKKQKNK
uniref:WD repeat-containing protein 74 n=1 Tax=Caligus clemensi TaxID=344056 RepID=C1C358_CALCM|nr:WD repeat-containing protein 74 [Caligus clemensi]